MKKISRIMALLMAVAMLAAMFSGCGKTEETKTVSSGEVESVGSKPYSGVTVEYASCFNEAEQQAIWLMEQAKEWESLTGGKIHFNFAGRDVLTSVKSDILIGKAPDIIDNDASELAAALLSGGEILLEPLDDVLDRCAVGEASPLKDNMNGSYSLYNVDGKCYTMPFIFITSGFFYNKTLFKELNLTVPKTWDEFLTVCDAIEASGIPALAADGNISFYNSYYFITLCQRIMGGGSFYAAAMDKTGATWDKPEYLQAAEMVSELSAAGRNYFQEGYAGSAYPAAQSDWAMGGAGMIYCGTWIPLETSSLTDANFEFGFFPCPSVEGGKGSTTQIEAHLMAFGVPKDAANKEAAKDFIAYCSSKKAADRLVELTDNMAARTDAIYPEALVDVKPTVDAAIAYQKNYDGAMGAAPEWFANVFYAADDSLFFGTLSPEEFIAQIKADTIKFYSNK